MKTIRVVAADHPSLDRDVASFLGGLLFVRPSLLRGLSERGGFRLAAIECGQVIGLARVAADGELHIAVDTNRRGVGIGTMLGRAALQRAIALEYSRVVMRNTRRSQAARSVGDSLGCVLVENACGRTDVIAHLPSGLRSA